MAKIKVRKERTAFIAFYVSDEEKDAIVNAAQCADMSISDYCRRMLLSSREEERRDV